MQTYIPDEDKMERLQQLADEAGVPLGVFLAGVKDYYDEERQRAFADLRASLDRGMEDIKNGKGIPYNRDTFHADVERKARELEAAGEPISDDVQPA